MRQGITFGCVNAAKIQEAGEKQEEKEGSAQDKEAEGGLTTFAFRHALLCCVLTSLSSMLHLDGMLATHTNFAYAISHGKQVL